jgi:AcrR family transcriptional regulator/transcriptional regulator with XRE-family HTH domain
VLSEAEERRALGARIRDARTVHGLSLRGLAAELGVSPATMSAMENGHSGVDAVRIGRIAAILHTSVSHLITGSDDRRPVDEGGGAPLYWRDYAPTELTPALAGALSAFVDVGFHAATIRDIARRSGLSAPGIYHHFASKEDMLVALLRMTVDDLLRRCEAARTEGHSPVERFCNLIECLVLFHSHRRELSFVGASEMRSVSVEHRDSISRPRLLVQQMVDREVTLGCESGKFHVDDPKIAARAVVMMCTSIPQWFRINEGPLTPEHLASQYVALALGLCRYRE